MTQAARDRRGGQGAQSSGAARAGEAASSPRRGTAVGVSTRTAAVRKPAASPRLCVALLVALGFALGCSEFVVIGIEPEIAEALGVSLAQAGQLISFFSVSYAVLTPVLALTTGRIRRFHLLVAYTVILNVGNLIAVLAGSFPVLLAARMVIGAVSGGLLAVGVTYIPELVAPKQVSMTISVVYAAFSVAMVLATSLGKMIADALSWHAAIVAAFVLTLAVSVALVAVIPRTGAGDVTATVGQQLRMLGDVRVLAGIAIFVFGVGSVYVFYGYVSPYLEDILGLSSAQTSMALMGYGVMCLFSNLLSGLIETRLGMRALVVTFLAQAALLAGLFAVGTATAPALALVMAIGLSMYLVSTPCVAMFMDTAARDYPTALTLATSLEPMSFNTGIAFGTAVGGAVVSGIGMAYAGLVGAAFSLVAAALTTFTVFQVARKRRMSAQAG